MTTFKRTFTMISVFMTIESNNGFWWESFWTCFVVYMKRSQDEPTDLLHIYWIKMIKTFETQGTMNKCLMSMSFVTFRMTLNFLACMFNSIENTNLLSPPLKKGYCSPLIIHHRKPLNILLIKLISLPWSIAFCKYKTKNSSSIKGEIFLIRHKWIQKKIFNGPSLLKA